MNVNKFFELVVSMREAQKAYFKTREYKYLTESKRLESLVDKEINQVINRQLDLFDK